MKSPIAYLRVVPALVIPLALLTFATHQTDQTTVSAAPMPGPAPVFVTNSGAAQAVPTAAQGTTAIIGNVGITGTPSVNIANSPTVGLASGAQVQIGNAISNPVLTRDVDRPTAQPFNQRMTLNFNDGFAFAGAGGGPTGDFTVPPGKRMVIEWVTVSAEVPVGQQVLFARIDSSTFSHFLTLTNTGNDFNGHPFFVGTHRVFLIIEPGTLVDQTAFRNGGSGSGFMNITISGYLVDAP